MTNPSESVRELALLETIERDPDVNQSSIASQLDVAVGTVNWHLKRLIEKGYVKIKRANRKNEIRLHQLELLPGVGKKHMLDILAQREKKPFESFKDLSTRVTLLPDPHKLIVERILEELKGESKYYIMTRPPYQPRPY